MATSVVYNGVTYSVPSFTDVGYAQGAGNLSQYLVALASALSTAGGTLTGPINMGGFKITNLANGSAPTDAVNFSQLTAAVTGVISITGTANQIIASSPTGAVTLSLPQSVDTNANVVFATALLDSATIESFGSLVFKDHTTNTITIQTPSAVTSYGLVLPAAQGGVNTFLQNDGSGNLSFVAGNAGTVTSVSGTANQITSTGGATPVLSLISTTVSVISGTGTVTPDASTAGIFETTVTGALTINGPTGGADGQKITFRLLNDATHSVTFATGAGNFRFGTDIPSYTNSVSLTDYIGAIWNNAASRWDIVAVSQGF